MCSSRTPSQKIPAAEKQYNRWRLNRKPRSGTFPMWSCIAILSATSAQWINRRSLDDGCLPRSRSTASSAATRVVSGIKARSLSIPSSTNVDNSGLSSSAQGLWFITSSRLSMSIELIIVCTMYPKCKAVSAIAEGLRPCYCNCSGSEPLGARCR